MKRSLMFGVLGLLLLNQANASVKQSARLSQEMRVIDPNHKHLKMLSKHPELVIDHVNKNGYEVYGPKGLDVFLAKKSILFFAPPPATSRGEYPSPEATLKKVQDVAKAHPDLVKLTEIGKSVEGRSLTFARLTAPDSASNPIEKRPEFKYIANMHGDEIVGRELMVLLIQDLANQYGKDSRITKMMDSIQIYILPSMNPDGAFHKVRYNKNGADLNRAFPDFTTEDNVNVSTGREPEIQAIMKFQAEHHFKLSANFHGGSEVVNYPYDTEAELFPLDNLVQKLSLDYANLVPYIHASTEFKNGITNGYAWYEVNGGMQDWSYHWHNDLQLTIELTNTKWPDYSTVANTYQLNRSALLTLIEDTLQF